MKELPDILIEYNSRIHSSIAMSPSDARKKENYKTIQTKHLGKFMRKNFIRKTPKYKIGDRVRISRILKTFAKASREGNWSEEIFEIENIQYTDPVTYILKDLKGETLHGAFYELELQKTAQEI